MSILDQLVANYAGGLQQSTNIAMNRLNQPTAADLFLQNLRQKQQTDMQRQQMENQASYQRGQLLNSFMSGAGQYMEPEQAKPTLQAMGVDPSVAETMAAGLGGKLGIAQGKQETAEDKLANQTRMIDWKIQHGMALEPYEIDIKKTQAEKNTAGAGLLGSKTEAQNINNQTLDELNKARVDYWKRRTANIGASGGSGGAGVFFTPDEESAFAQDVKKYPQLINLIPSRGKMGEARMRVLKNVYGGDIAPDLAGASAAYKSNQAAMQQLVKSSDMVAAFENTAKKNADILRKNLGGMIDSGSPILNQPIAALRRNSGSREAQAILTSLEPVRQEYGKILSGSVGSVAGLPVTQVEHMRKILDERMTLGQILDTLDILENDARNRHDAYTEKIREVARRMSSAPEAAQPQGAQPQAGAASFSNVGANPRHPKAGWSETGVNGQPKGWYVRTSQGFMRVE